MRQKNFHRGKNSPRSGKSTEIRSIRHSLRYLENITEKGGLPTAWHENHAKNGHTATRWPTESTRLSAPCVPVWEADDELRPYALPLSRAPVETRRVASLRAVAYRAVSVNVAGVVTPLTVAWMVTVPTVGGVV